MSILGQVRRKTNDKQSIERYWEWKKRTQNLETTNNDECKFWSEEKIFMWCGHMAIQISEKYQNMGAIGSAVSPSSTCSSGRAGWVRAPGPPRKIEANLPCARLSIDKFVILNFFLNNWRSQVPDWTLQNKDAAAVRLCAKMYWVVRVKTRLNWRWNVILNCNLANTFECSNYWRCISKKSLHTLIHYTHTVCGAQMRKCGDVWKLKQEIGKENGGMFCLLIQEKSSALKFILSTM